MALTCSNFFGAFFSFIGIFIGYSAFITFTFVYHNYHAGVLAFLSGIYASIVFLMNILDIRSRIHEWYTTEHLKSMRLFSVIGMLIGLSTTVWYLFIYLYFRIPILPIDTSMVIPSVWSFMTLKWSIVLFFATKKYTRIVEEEQALLPTSSGRRY